MSSKMEANMRHIARHEAKPNPKEMASTTVTRGFEAVAFPKIVRELKDSDLIVKQKSLLAARELLGTATQYVQCIAHGITPAVIALLQDPDATVRERAAGTMRYIATKEIGARDLTQHGGVSQLVSLLVDDQPAVRNETYSALIEAARFNCVRNEMVELKSALPKVLSLVLSEESSRAHMGLMLLNACVQVRNNNDALKQLVEEASAISSLAMLISSDQPEVIQEQAAQLLGLVASNFDDAKLEAVQADCVPKLLALLSQRSNVLLAGAAATALMVVTNIRDGKYAVVNCEGGLEALSQWLEPTLEQLCVNVSQCITNVAEAPEARPVLKQCGALEKLVSIHEGPHPEIVKRGAAEALRQCKFDHRPYQPLLGRTVDPKDFPEDCEVQSQVRSG